LLSRYFHLPLPLSPLRNSRTRKGQHQQQQKEDENFCGTQSSMSRFKSLFLPLNAEEEAVFASVFPLMLTMPSTIEGGAAAAAGEHSSPPALPRGGGLHLSSSNAAAANNASTTASAAAYSPVEGPGNYMEGGFSPTPRESATEAQARRGAPLRSLVFAVGSARADALLVVLRSAHVVVFGLDRPHAPPYELYRICPLPTTQQLQAAREMSSHKLHHHNNNPHSNNARSLRGTDGDSAVRLAEATCASLIPLPISYCCRIIVPADGRSHGTTIADEEEEEDEIYLRGVVGSSDGRVSLFSDVAYTLSFAAHETPVAQVNAVLLPPSSLNTIGSISHSNNNNNTRTAGSGGASRPASPTSQGRQGRPVASLALSSRVSSSHHQQQHQQQRCDNVQLAMERLGIVTSGTDGVILLWRRLEGTMSPVVLLRPSSFARRVPYTIYYPSALSALLSACAPRSSREAAVDAELCCPPSCLVHATSQHAHGLRVRHFASLAPSGSTCGSAGAAERAAPTWLSLPMPGSWISAVTAMATHHNITLVARETSLFSMVRFDSRAATRIWKAESVITQVVLLDTLALAVCAKAGAVHVLSIHPVTGQGVHQRSFYSYNNRPIYHVSLHEASLLMCIVDVCGSTELVLLPSDVLLHQHAHPLSGGYTLGSAECLNLLASMAALRAKVIIEDVKGAGVSPEAPGGATSMYEANAALDQLNERLLLARLAVPEECDRYMAANQNVF
jgi:hypothetical protein